MKVKRKFKIGDVVTTKDAPLFGQTHTITGMEYRTKTNFREACIMVELDHPELIDEHCSQYLINQDYLKLV